VISTINAWFNRVDVVLLRFFKAVAIVALRWLSRALWQLMRPRREPRRPVAARAQSVYRAGVRGEARELLVDFYGLALVKRTRRLVRLGRAHLDGLQERRLLRRLAHQLNTKCWSTNTGIPLAIAVSVFRKSRIK
jgi:hypothetical protein